MRASQIVAFCASVVVLLGLSGVSASMADVPVAPEITGLVQDWNAESRYMVVGGVRYEFGEDFVVLSESGQPMPVEAVDAGVPVRFWSENGVVETVILVNEDEQR